jgi:hypothetical protein
MKSEISPRVVGQSIGVLFLITIVSGVFAQGLVSERLINFTDATATAARDLFTRQSRFGIHTNHRCDGK